MTVFIPSIEVVYLLSAIQMEEITLEINKAIAQRIPTRRLIIS